MNKSWSDVNTNNSAFVLSYTNPVGLIGLRITEQNYATVNALAQNFADTLGAELVVLTAGSLTWQVTNLLPDSSTSINGTTNNIISFQVQAGTGSGAAFVAVPHTITNPLIQSFEAKGDFYALIGGNRITSGSSTDPTITVAMGAGPNYPMIVQCLYPAQRSTSPYIYIRTNLETAALETSSLDRPSGQDTIQEILSTNILGRAAVNTEYCNYSIKTNGVYYIDITQKSVSTIRLYLTDEANRPIGRPYGSTLLTATGTGTQQSTLGNLTFSAVVRIDLIQTRPPHDNIFPQKPILINSKMSNQIIAPKPPL